MTEPYIHADQVGAKATFDYVTAALQADTQAEFCRTRTKPDATWRARDKALLVFHRTNWPAAEQVTFFAHYRVLSSDGVTRYDVTVKGGEWLCSCPAHGPCWHAFYAKLWFYTRRESRLAMDALTPAPEPARDEMPVAGLTTSRSRVYAPERVA